MRRPLYSHNWLCTLVLLNFFKYEEFFLNFFISAEQEDKRLTWVDHTVKKRGLEEKSRDGLRTRGLDEDWGPIRIRWKGMQRTKMDWVSDNRTRRTRPALSTLMKKKIKFSSYIRKFRMEQLQSHIWLTASSYMVKYLRISSYIRKPFLIYDFATAPLWISLYMRKFDFLFYQCRLKKYYYHVAYSCWMNLNFYDSHFFTEPPCSVYDCQ